MPSSATRLLLQSLWTALKTTVKHYTSKSYPADWNLAFHIQLAVLRKLDETSLNSTIEEVLSLLPYEANNQLQSFAMGYLTPAKDGWFLPTSFDPTEDDKHAIEHEMRTVLENLGPEFELPEIKAAALRGEWQGGEGNVGNDLPNQETFKRLSEATKDGPVVLMLHGGGHITGSPAMERSATFKVARMCRGKVFAVDFRLAPQHPFPAALIDAIVAYKYLIQPPAEAWHTAVDPKRLVIAGDSSGVPSPFRCS